MFQFLDKRDHSEITGHGAGQRRTGLACPATTGLGNPVANPDGACGLPLLVSAVRIAFLASELVGKRPKQGPALNLMAIQTLPTGPERSQHMKPVFRRLGNKVVARL